MKQQFRIQNTQKWRLREPPRANYCLETSFTETCEDKGAPNDGYNRLREYKDVKGSEAGGRSTRWVCGVGTDMGLETEAIRHKIVMSGTSRDQSVPLEKKPSIGTRERSKTKRPGRPVKKKSLAISRANKPAIAKKPSNPTNPEKKINKPVKKRVKLEKIDPDDPIETEDKLFADKLAKNSSSDTRIAACSRECKDMRHIALSKEQVVKDKKSTSHSSKSNDNEIFKSEKAEEPVSNAFTETFGSNDDCLMTTIPNEKLTTRTITNDKDSQSCLASNHRIAKRQKSGARRKIPRSSVMTIWHRLRVRSRHTPTSTKESSNLDRVQDPFLSLFFPAMIASDLNRTRIIRDEREKRNELRKCR